MVVVTRLVHNSTARQHFSTCQASNENMHCLMERISAFRYILVIGLLNINSFLADPNIEDVEDPVNSLRIGQKLNDTTSKRETYLIYEVNPGEGFNLRRDVFIRVANLVRNLQIEGESVILVLPPWRRLYHWRSETQQNAIPWKKFFDVENINKYVSAIEFQDFLKLNEGPGIDLIVYLQRHPDGFSNGWEEKIEEASCTNKPVYWKDVDGTYHGHFWGLEYVYGREFKCVSVQGTANILTKYIQAKNMRSIFIDRFEEVLHIGYGDSEFWKARRSLVFAKPLRREADRFREEFLNSTDEHDETPYHDKDWRQQVPKDGTARGGDYLAVHMRRGDFVFSGREGVPSIKAVAKQLRKLLKKTKLDKVFLATDGNEQEIKELQSTVKATIYKYQPSPESSRRFGDGGIAIIDQWIAAHGKYFIGSCESTFSFRIHEERDILGFSADSTYNCFCTEENIGKCEQPTRWRVQFT